MKAFIKKFDNETLDNIFENLQKNKLNIIYADATTQSQANFDSIITTTTVTIEFEKIEPIKQQE